MENYITHDSVSVLLSCCCFWKLLFKVKEEVCWRDKNQSVVTVLQFVPSVYKPGGRGTNA